MPTRSIKKLLIANRGEIAVRVIRACREMGITTVAVYSDLDKEALHVQMADEAVRLGPPPAAESYLQVDKILDAARHTGADAIHPGFGFLSENEDFAQAVMDAGLIWVGPPPAAIFAMGSKTEARALMEMAGVPIVPGYQGEDQSDERLFSEAERIGYPILVKAAAGGGGKGMRRVEKAGDLLAAVAGCKREAKSFFGDDQVFLEKYIEQPRHIEFQIFGDHHGHVVHLFERECSIQRRHQKVVEECPSSVLTDTLRARMGEAAVAAARAVGYTNAGTVEFIFAPDGSFYFLEMNTRLQVEHPVTEEVVGVDLVQLQLRVAMGFPLPFEQAQLSRRGHAIEVRVYAEDPGQGFVPAGGTILALSEPSGPGVRVDSALYMGMEIPLLYDPMLAKLIVWGENREVATRRMKVALDHFVVLGVTTNIPFLRDILDQPAWQSGSTTTAFISEHLPDWRPRQEEPDPRLLVALAVAEMMGVGQSSGTSAHSSESPSGADAWSPWGRLSNWRVGG